MVRFVASLALGWALLAGVCGSARADLGCSAEVNRTSVATGDIIVLTVTAEGDIDWSADFSLPDLPGIQVSGGGTNQSMSFVNGRRSTSVSKTYYLRVDRDQTFTIGPVVIRSGQEQCATDPVRIDVQVPDPSAKVPPADSGNRTRRPGGSPSRSNPLAGDAVSGKAGDDVFVTLDVDRNEAWVGQQLLLRFRYFRRVQPWNNPKYTAPRTEGFWREDLGPEINTRQMVSGRAYNVTEIRYAIFPARAGKLEIGPAELQFPDDVFDRFFSSRRHQGPRILRTDPVVVNVRDLPKPAPDGYSGLVASRLSLTSTVDRDSVPRGEPVGLQMTLESDAFLQGFSGLEVPEPPHARLHDAGEDFSSTPNRERLIGTMKVEKVIVPSQTGTFRIEPVKVSWFDAGQGRYRTTASSLHEIQVLESDLPRAEDLDSGFLRNEIARLGQDLAFIHQGGNDLGRITPVAPRRPVWWIAVLLPGLLLGAWWVWLRRLSADRRDPQGRRSRRALVTARKALADAERIADPIQRVDTLARALAGFVADCTARPVAAIGAEQIRSFCGEHDLPEAAECLVDVLNSADRIRYGGQIHDDPARTTAELEGHLESLYQAERSRVRTGVPVERVVSWAVLALCIVASGPTQAQSLEGPGADPARLLAEGNRFYTEGDLEQALARYDEALTLGVDDAVLYFNMGNTYARRGELGHAVVSYLRAQRLDPRNQDIRKNLSWVRGHIEDLELNSMELPLFIAQFVTLVHALTLNEWSWIAVVWIWFLAGGLAWVWYREGLGTRLRRVLLVVAGLLAVTVVIVGWRYQDEQVRRQAVIVVPQASVRSGPAENFPVLFEVHDGLTLRVEEERDGWMRIGMGGDWVGWVPAASLEEVRRRPEPHQG